MLLVLYRDDGTLIEIIPGGEVRDDEVFVGGQRVASGINCRWTYVPDQEYRHLYRTTETGQLVLVGTVKDLKQFTPEEKTTLIDRKTAEAINKTTHPFTPIEEQIGVLREQIVQILNALGIAPTPEFAKLNEVAIQAIEEGRKLKEGLYAKDNPTS